MVVHQLDELAGLLENHRNTVLAQWRHQVRKLPSAQQLDTPTLNDHIPKIIDQLVIALRIHADDATADVLAVSCSAEHGLQRVYDGFDIEEVVAEYNILRGCIHDLADQHALSLQGKPFHIMNRVLDEAIAAAVKTFATQRALEIQQRRDEYLAFVAHDLRTPLNAISIATKTLELVLRDPAKASEAAHKPLVNVLRRNIEYLDKLVDKVLKENVILSAETDIKLERRHLDLWPLVESLVQDLLPLSSQSGTRLINAVPSEVTIYADASLLRRILQNLIVNAITYTPHGDVTIGARAVEANGATICWVNDNGCGIAENRLKKIFDMFETDPYKTGGVGLGLAIVRSFVEAHGGKITVESTEGVGSTFEFTLPGLAKQL